MCGPLLWRLLLLQHLKRVLRILVVLHETFHCRQRVLQVGYDVGDYQVVSLDLLG